MLPQTLHSQISACTQPSASNTSSHPHNIMFQTMQTICFLATCQSQHILCTHCWVELSLMLSTLLYFIIVILILLVINRCLINCSHYLIYFAIVNSFLYVLFVGIPTCSKPVTSPPRFLHGATNVALKDWFRKISELEKAAPTTPCSPCS